MKSLFKVPGGKLIKVELTLEKNTITKIKITGDFFCHPEEKFSEIEKSLVHCDWKENALKKNILATLKKHNITLFGFSADDLVKTILGAV